MKNLKWIFIIGGMLAGVFTPWQIQVPIMAVLLMVYIACFQPKWPNLQIVMASLFGGFSMGIGLQFFIAYSVKGHIIEMFIVPMLTWLLLRIVFYGVETKYSLDPNEVLTQIRTEEEVATNAVPNLDKKIDHRNHDQSTASAWAGDISGQASQPDANGKYMRYEYFVRGEICMGGPSYGDAIFNNSCAFGGVGPSIVISDDGHYAAMTLPSRNEWGLLIADLRDKHVYEVNDGRFWEIDRIENNIIYGRHSPITSNSAEQLSIANAIQTAEKLPIIQDDGWWVIDYPGREPFKQYKAVTIASKGKTHKVTFVPDLKPFKNNPFLRSQHPIYTVLVDDALIDLDTGIPAATWVNGHATDSVQDGRFLLVAGQLIDFKDVANDTFSIKNRTALPFIKGCDDNTNLSFEYGELSDTNDGFLLAKAYVLPRSTGWGDAEYNAYSCTSPWDEEEVTYWDITKQKRLQARKSIQRFIEYKIDLDKYSRTKQLKNCVVINLANRGHAKNTASLASANQSNDQGGYSAYQLTASCGLSLKNVIHETIWSNCGRYLAVVYFEAPPQVPHKIAIIDFKTATVKNIAGIYALPSFIWFDENMLDFTHVVGIEEQVSYHTAINYDGAGNQVVTRFNQAEHSQKIYDLLFATKNERINAMAASPNKHQRKSNGKIADIVVQRVSQHCMLFAPEFDVPVLQPPAD